MAYQKLQSREALTVLTSDDVRIPDPTSIIALDPIVVTAGVLTGTDATVGTADFSVAGTLTDVGTKFTELGIQPGAIVYNTTAGKAYYVTAVTDDLNLSLSPSDAGGATDSYSIYARPTLGCTLFIGTAGDVNVRMAEQNGNTTTAAAPANQTILYKGLANGSFMPIQVVQVLGTSTDATDIIAMW